MRSLRFVRVMSLCTSLVLAAACSDQSVVTSVEPETGDISDRIRDSGRGGSAGFYFLYPTRSPAPFAGAFDPLLAPVVTICLMNGAVCGPEVARYTLTSGPDGQVLQMSAGLEAYWLTWGTNSTVVGSIYRLSVFVDSYELGSLDIAIVLNSTQAQTIDRTQFVPHIRGRTLAVAFRIEQQAVPTAERKPLAGGVNHTCALANGGNAYCWGGNNSGQLGTGDVQQSVTPAAVVGGQRFIEITTGLDHTCAIDASGAAWCWGYNVTGALGIGIVTPYESTPTRVAGGHVFTRIAAGAHHTCGLKATGEALCWGWNLYAQLGNGTIADASTPVLVAGGQSFTAIDAGTAHTCALNTAGAAYCWGLNLSGQVGNGSLNTTPPYMASLVPLAVTGGQSFRTIAVGGNHSCAVSNSGATYCWGYNYYGQLGRGTLSNDPNPALRGIPTPGPVAGTVVFRDLDIGNSHTCGLTAAGAAYCWGHDYFGQLGTGTLAPAPTYSLSMPTRVAGTDVWRTLAAGWLHTCAINTQGVAKCWGFDSSGQLGDGGSSSQNPTPVSVRGASQLTFDGS